MAPPSYADHFQQQQQQAAPAHWSHYQQFNTTASTTSNTDMSSTTTPTHTSRTSSVGDSTHSLSSPSTSATSSTVSTPMNNSSGASDLQLPPANNHHITYNYKSNTYEYTNAGQSYSSEEDNDEEDDNGQMDDEEYNGSEAATPRAKKRKLSVSSSSKASSGGSNKRNPKPKKHRGVMNQAIIDVGYVLNNQERIYYIYSPWFDQTVEVYTAVGDSKRRILFRASVLADKFKCATNKVGMYLQRRRHNSEGLYQATGFRSKPHGRTGLKSGGYFLSMEVCIGFEKHWHKQAARVEANAAAQGGDSTDAKQSGSKSAAATPRPSPRSVRAKIESIPAAAKAQEMTPPAQYERLVQPTVAEHLSQSLPSRSRSVYGPLAQPPSVKRSSNNLHAMLPQLSPVHNSVQMDAHAVPSLDSSYDYSFQPYDHAVAQHAPLHEPSTPAPIAPKLPPQFDQPLYQQLLHTQFQQYPEDKPATRVRIVTPTPLHPGNHPGHSALYNRYMTTSPLLPTGDLMLKRSNTPLKPLLPPSTTNSPAMLFSSSLSIPSMPRITPSPLTIPHHNDSYTHTPSSHSMSAYNDNIAGPVRHVRPLKRSMPSLVPNLDAPANARYYTPGSQKLFQQQLYHAMQQTPATESSTSYNDNGYYHGQTDFNTYDDTADLGLSSAAAYPAPAVPAMKKQQSGDIKASELRMLNDLLTSQSTFQYGLTVEQVNTLRMLNGAL